MFLYKGKTLILKQGELQIPVLKIAKQQKGPFYLYDIYGLKKWYEGFSKSLNSTSLGLKIFFAMKANANPFILKAFKKQGSGVDVVSIGEAKQALKVGFKPKDIIFSGVGKSFTELEFAVKKRFFQINVESLGELKRLAKITRQQNKPCSIGLRINPNVDFSSHPYIKTGLSGHKFGFEEQQLPELLKFIRSKKLIQLKGLSMHLGSQICDLEPLFKAISQLKALYIRLQAEKHPLSVLDIGGGLGINYQTPHLKDEKTRLRLFSQGLKKLFKGFKGQVITEPGRFLVAPFGLLCAQIEYIKKTPKKQFLILNSGMNHFLRPALYGAKHRVLALKKSAKRPQNYDIVGPICETGDIFAKNQALPEPKPEDWLALADTGAYGFVMANQYNGQALPLEICVDKGKILNKL